MRHLRKPIAWLLVFVFIFGKFSAAAEATTTYSYDLLDIYEVADVYPPAPEADLAADEADDTYAAYYGAAEDIPPADEITPEGEAHFAEEYTPVPEAAPPVNIGAPVARTTAGYIGIVPAATNFPSGPVPRSGDEHEVDGFLPNFYIAQEVGDPVPLFPGQIWTDTTLVYERDLGGFPTGLVYVTIYVWGRPYVMENGTEVLLGAADPFVAITTRLGDFAFGSAPGFPGTIDSSTPGAVTFLIEEDDIKDPAAPFSFTYTIYLPDRLPAEWLINHWYSTLGSNLEVRFEPSSGNGYYWTKELVETPAFEITANWNNGTGLNSAVIIDRELGLTIAFDKNNSPASRPADAAAAAAAPPNSYWVRNASVTYADGTRSTFYWYLEWQKGTDAAGRKTYRFTVWQLLEEDLGVGTPTLLNVTYEVYLTGAGGNQGQIGTRTITSEHYFRRPLDSDLYVWDGAHLVFNSPFVARIILEDLATPTGTLRITKNLEMMYPDQEWYFLSGEDGDEGGNWEFTARLFIPMGNAALGHEDDRYVVLRPTGLNTYEAYGTVDESELISLDTVITFSGTWPYDTGVTVYIHDLPIQVSSVNATPVIYGLYEFFTFEILGLIDVEFSVDGGGTWLPAYERETDHIFVSEHTFTIPHESTGEVTHVMIENTFDHGIGFLEIYKLLDGFPADWDIDSYTEFYVRVFDLEAQNFLLFHPEVLRAHDPINDPRSAGIAFGDIFTGTYWCVGNHIVGFTYYYSDTTPIMELPLSVYARLRISNLWTGIHYEVQEVRRVEGVTKDGAGGTLSTDDAWTAIWAGRDHLPFWASTNTPIDLIDPSNPLWWDENDNPLSWFDLWETVEPIISDPAWHARPLWHWGVIYDSMREDGTHDPTETVQFNLPTVVTLTNRYKFHGGNIVFEKELCPFAAAWGVTEDTTFYARVRTDELEPRLLVFVADPLGQEEIWRVIGFTTEDFDPITNPYAYQVLCPVGEALPPGRARTVIPFSAAQSARLIEVPVHPFGPTIEYRVEEVFPTAATVNTLLPEFEPMLGWDDKDISVVGPGPGYIVHVNADGFPMVDDADTIVTIENFFDPIEGNFVISKTLAGAAEAWSVTDQTTFYVVIYRVATGQRLTFLLDDDGAFIYAATSYIAPLPPGTPSEVISFSEANPAVLQGIREYFLAGNSGDYLVVEVDEFGVALPTDGSIGFTIGIDVAYVSGPGLDYNLFATVTNTFAPRFTVTYVGNGNTGGTVPVDSNNPYIAGETVTVLPHDLTRTNHTFTGWHRSDTNTVIQSGATFTMPAADVILTAQWTPTVPGDNGGGDPPTPPPPPPPPPGDFFVDEHIWFLRGNVARPGVTIAGAGDIRPLIVVQSPHDFEMRPDADITRAEVAIVFYRLLRPEFKGFTPAQPFSDVSGNEWFGLAVGTLTHHGIFDGYGGAFRPNDPITRGELAAVVSRFDDLIETTNNPFSDVFSNDWAYRYILSAAARGWFIGFPDGTFRSTANLSRAEFVTAANRVLERGILLEHIPDDVVEFIDLDGTHWAHADFMEAAHTHDWELHANGVTERWLAITGHGLDAAYNQ
ncbi:MAG: S-layer homology domain-containing protein [Oscillospiraceae bacterium]|nr:S-layer homology domain-containing protein [Oscillospiraceae bacterium]